MKPSWSYRFFLSLVFFLICASMEITLKGVADVHPHLLPVAHAQDHNRQKEVPDQDDDDALFQGPKDPNAGIQGGGSCGPGGCSGGGGAPAGGGSCGGGGGGGGGCGGGGGGAGSGLGRGGLLGKIKSVAPAIGAGALLGMLQRRTQVNVNVPAAPTPATGNGSNPAPAPTPQTQPNQQKSGSGSNAAYQSSIDAF